MHKKSFTFGMGVGILTMTALFFFVYSSIVRTGWNKERALLEAERDKAVAASAEQPARIGMTELEAVEYAESLGMIFPASTPDAAPAPSPTASPAVAPENTPEAEITPEPATTQTPEPAPTPAPTTMPPAESAAIPAPNADAAGWITFTIPEGLVASQVCGILEANGVVDDAAGLSRYLTEHGLTTKLAHGTYTVPAHCTYDELMTYWKVVD